MKNSRLTVDFIRDIIVNELGLDEDRVNIYNQKFIIPVDENLFVTIEYRASPIVLSSRNYMSDDQEETQDLNTQEFITIMLMSKNLQALQRKEEAIMALNSVYAQGVQEANSFKIFRNVRLTDVSAVEGATLMYRFDIDIVVLAWYHKVKTQEYFDNFRVELSVNDGLPNVEVEFDQPVTDPTL